MKTEISPCFGVHKSIKTLTHIVVWLNTEMRKRFVHLPEYIERQGKGRKCRISAYFSETKKKELALVLR